MCRGSSSAISCGCGSLTFTIISAASNTDGGVGKDRRAGLLIGRVGAVDAVAGLGLDEHLVAVGDELGDRRGRQPDPILVDLDFLRHPDAHLFVCSA